MPHQPVPVPVPVPLASLKDFEYCDELRRQLVTGLVPTTKDVERALSFPPIVIGCGVYDEILRAACFLGDRQLLNKFLLHGAVGWAAHREEVTWIRELLDSGADVMSRDASGKSALHYVSVKSAIHSMRLLVDRGANVDAEDAEGHTPLHDVCRMTSRHGNTRASIKALVDLGAYVNARNHAGLTPLHLLLEGELSSRLISALVDLGADATPIIQQVIQIRRDTHWTTHVTEAHPETGNLYRRATTIQDVAIRVFDAPSVRPHSGDPGNSSDEEGPPAPTTSPEDGDEVFHCCACAHSLVRWGSPVLVLGCGHAFCRSCALTLAESRCTMCLREVRWGTALRHT